MPYQKPVVFNDRENKVLEQHGRDGLIRHLETEMKGMAGDAVRIQRTADGQERYLTESEAARMDEIFAAHESTELKIDALAHEDNLELLSVPPLPRKVKPHQVGAGMTGM